MKAILHTKQLRLRLALLVAIKRSDCFYPTVSLKRAELTWFLFLENLAIRSISRLTLLDDPIKFIKGDLNAAPLKVAFYPEHLCTDVFWGANLFSDFVKREKRFSNWDSQFEHRSLIGSFTLEGAFEGIFWEDSVQRFFSHAECRSAAYRNSLWFRSNGSPLILSNCLNYFQQFMPSIHLITRNALNWPPQLFIHNLPASCEAKSSQKTFLKKWLPKTVSTGDSPDCSLKLFAGLMLEVKVSSLSFLDFFAAKHFEMRPMRFFHQPV